MAKRILRASAILLVNALFIYSYVSIGDCSTKSVSVESVLQKLKEKQDLILIDVRNAKEFEKFRIPASLNIPLFAVKTKTFLKPKPLILMNEGHSYKQLMDECTLLSKAGFAVSILNGGLYQWRRKGGPLEGDVFAQRELNEISPQTFLAGKSYENWMVVDVSKSPLTLSLSPGSGEEGGGEGAILKVIRIPFANNPKEFVTRVKSLIPPFPPLLKGGKGGFPETDFASIIIYDEKGKTYEEIEKHIQDAGIRNVLYLKGGFEGYKTFEQQQISMRQEKKVRIGKSNRDCPTCP